MNLSLSAMQADQRLLEDMSKVSTNSLEVQYQANGLLQILNERLRTFTAGLNSWHIRPGKFFLKVLQHLLVLSQRQKSTVSLYIVGLDHFKVS
jgi:hypothetical protein